MQFPWSNQSKSSHQVIIFRTLAVVFILLLIFQTSPRKFKTDDDSSDLSQQTDQGETACQSVQAIPNIVHFVLLLRDPADTRINLLFRQFIAIYSASHHLNPEIIYIHTDLGQDAIDRDLQNSSNRYVQALTKIPHIKFNHVTAPEKTSSGREISELAHRSDFVRTAALKEHGGVYLDDDAYVLRDLKPFRQLGFETVTGRQYGGSVCNAVMLSRPESKLITAYKGLQDRIFDGGWETHSIRLLTSLVQEFAPLDYQSLVLPQDTFFPGSWEAEHLRWMYQLHDDIGGAIEYNHPTENLTDFIENFQLQQPEDTWQKDWRLTYILHGWTSGLKYIPDEMEGLFGGPDGITPEYILKRRSNLARAVYPAVQEALTSGVLSIDET